MKKMLLFAIFVGIILCGCGKKNSSAVPNFVTHVDISCEQNGKNFSIRYIENEKVEAVLLYLRLLKKGRIPDYGPPFHEHSIFEIRVHMSNGQSRLYKQVDHRYIWRDKTGWSAIPPEQASNLYALLRYYPTDL